MPSTTTISDIIQRAILELDGFAINQKLIDEAALECERTLERVAAAALKKVLNEHIALLMPKKQGRKSSKPSPSAKAEASHSHNNSTV